MPVKRIKVSLATRPKRRARKVVVQVPRPRRAMNAVVRAPMRAINTSRVVRVTPFEKCVLGPVSAPPMGMGVPDGNNLLSVVVDHRQIVTVSPLADGRLQVAMHPSPLGSLCMGTGTATQTAYKVNHTTGAIVNVATFANSEDLATANAVSYYNLQPFKEWLPTVAGYLQNGSQNSGSLRVQGWRILTNKGKVTYTGSDLNNAGVVAIGRQDIRVENVSQPLVGDFFPVQGPQGRNRQFISGTGPLDFDGTAQLAGATIWSAGELRCGAEVINVPYDYEYQGWVDEAATVFVNPSSGAVTTNFGQLYQREDDPTLTQGGSTPGIGHAPTTFVAANGMSVGSSLTFTIQTCVEYTLAFSSPMARFAHPSPPLDRAATHRVKQVAREIPSAKRADNGGWFSNALSWYGNAMADIYKGVTGTATELAIGRNIWKDQSSLGVDTTTARGLIGGVTRRGRAAIR